MSIKISLLLVIAIVLTSLLPINMLVVQAADATFTKAGDTNNSFTDMPDENHWSYNALKNAIDNELLKGYNNKINPESNATRAQIAAVINRAFGAVDTADISAFIDVSEKDWYYTDMSKALNMETFLGSTGHKLLPLDNATRQEVFCIIARALKLSSTNIEALNKFSDKDDIAIWAQESLAALVENNYLHGSNGKINPNGKITLAEFAQILDNIIKSYITKAGTYTLSTEGNVMVNCPNVVLKDCTIKGDLIAGDGIGNGDITLDNTKIEGRLLARGGGQNTILIKSNSTVGNVIISKTGSGAIRIKTEDGARVEYVYIDDGKDDVILEGTYKQITVKTDTPVVIKNARVSLVDVKAEGADISIEGKSSITTTDFDKAALDSTIVVAEGSTVNKMSINNPKVTVIGWEKAKVNTGSSSSRPAAEDLIAPTYESYEVTGEKTLRITFSEPVCDGTNNTSINAANFRVSQLKPEYVQQSATISFSTDYLYTIQSAELSGDSITLSFQEALAEGKIRVTINALGTEVAAPIQDYAGNKVSQQDITFNHTNDGSIISEITVKTATQAAVTPDMYSEVHPK